MILVGNQRGGARDLAVHLLKEENDHVHVYEIDGFASDNLMDAFKEIHAISKGTRCKQFLYSLSVNPPPGKEVSTEDFIKAIDEAAKRLGLEGQVPYPRHPCGHYQVSCSTRALDAAHGRQGRPRRNVSNDHTSDRMSCAVRLLNAKPVVQSITLRTLCDLYCA